MAASVFKCSHPRTYARSRHPVPRDRYPLFPNSVVTESPLNRLICTSHQERPQPLTGQAPPEPYRQASDHLTEKASARA